MFKLVKIDNTFQIMEGVNIVASGEIWCYSGCWTLISGFVKREYRGRGLHHWLIRSRVTEIFKRGGTKARVWVKPTNVNCLNNLISEGFKFVKVRKRKFNKVEYICLELNKK